MATTIQSRLDSLEGGLNKLINTVNGLTKKLNHLARDEDEDEEEAEGDDTEFLIVFQRRDVDCSDEDIAEFRVKVMPYSSTAFHRLQAKMKCRDRDHPDCLVLRVQASSPKQAYEFALYRFRSLDEPDRTTVIDRLS